MKLVTKLVLLCAAALAFAAATDGNVAPSGPAQFDATQHDPHWPANAIPPSTSWAGVFNASWR